LPRCDFNFVHFPEKFFSANVEVLLRLTESAAILRYLGSKFALPEYPTELKARAKVDEALDWFNTQFYRDYAYGVVYPQIFPHHKRPTDEHQSGVIAWGTERARAWFGVLDKHLLGASKPYLTGEQITIADYFGACIVTAGETIRCDFSAFPNVDRWIGNMKQLGSWNNVNEALHGFTQYLKDQPFQAI